MRYLLTIFFIGLLHGAFAANLPAYTTAKVTSMTPLVGNFYHIYSPSLHNDKMWMGGWMSASDMDLQNAFKGNDLLYVSKLVGSTWQSPTPVQWKNHPNAGLKPGYLANDPSIVRRNDNGWYYMYYTVLPENWRDLDIHLGLVRFNQINFAFSVDNGATWEDSVIVIGQNNGLDNYGAWSPSALIKNNEVWIYFHTNEPNPRILRSRMNINGWQRIDTIRTNLTGLSNVDVKEGFGYFWLTANKTDLREIVLYRSTDGINFYPFDELNPQAAAIIDGALGQGGQRDQYGNIIKKGKTGTLITAANSDFNLLTPSLQVLNATSFLVFFGYAVNDHAPSFPYPRSTSIHAWRLELAIEPPVVVAAGRGCEDRYCLWVNADKTEKDAYIEIRDTRTQAVLGSYVGTALTRSLRADGKVGFTLRLRTAVEKQRLNSIGLNIVIVNPNLRNSSNPFAVR